MARSGRCRCPGYVTPKITVGAVVGNDDGDPDGATPTAASGSTRPVGLMSATPQPRSWSRRSRKRRGSTVRSFARSLCLTVSGGGFTRIPLVSLVFHCRATGGTPTPHPLECLDVGFFAEDSLPDPTAGADLWAAMRFGLFGARMSPCCSIRPAHHHGEAIPRKARSDRDHHLDHRPRDDP